MSTAIAFSAVTGYVFKAKGLHPEVLAVFAGVLLLAGSATALNQYQEREQDALMSRTKNRPIPSGDMKPSTALVYALIMGLAGIILLYFLSTPLTAALGLFNILWYNGVYTPLKRKTGFVVIVGAVTGAIPPMMGWTAAGGRLSDKGILLMAAFFFLWQIPHFLLLLLRYKEDYKRAGFRSATNTLNDNQIKSITFAWILGTSLITLFFPFFGIVSGIGLIALMIILNILMVGYFYRSVFNRNLTFNIGSAFGSLYIYQLSVLAILMVQALK